MTRPIAGGKGLTMIRVMVSMEGRLFSEGVANLLDSAGGVEVAWVTGGEKDTVEKARAVKPDVILTDLKTFRRSFEGGCPEGARILLVAPSGEAVHPAFFGSPVSGSIPDSSCELMLQTAIKAVAQGVLWTDGALPA